MKISCQWLRDFVNIVPPMERVAEALTMAGLEVKKVDSRGRDTIFEIEITSNRPDWLSHWGVAREISAVNNLILKPLAKPAEIKRVPISGWKVEIKDLEGCPYYTGVYMEGISQEPTPEFMKERLEACGIRPINLIVDITNYVLLEFGQPLHAFDADLLKNTDVCIRRARAAEKFLTISGKELALTAHDLVIAVHEQPVALAGVMGGKNSEINERTRNIFLESAFFQPRTVRQTSKRFDITTDSSYRFERRVDPELVDEARERAVDLIRQYAKPRSISSVIRFGKIPPTSKKKIHLSSLDIEKNLGICIKTTEVNQILKNLGFDVAQEGAKSWAVTAPSFRADVTRPIDLIEEIARIYGYNQIPETLPSIQPLAQEDNPLLRLGHRARNYFSGAGFFETVTFSLVSSAGLSDGELKNALKVHNPQNAELVWMRPNLITSLLNVVKRNYNHASKGCPVFEIANTYYKPKNLNDSGEVMTLALMLSGLWKPKSWNDPEREASYHDLKGLLVDFLASLGISNIQFKSMDSMYFEAGLADQILVLGISVGRMGQISHANQKNWDIEKLCFAFEINLEELAKLVTWIPRVHELPRFPAIERDLAVVVEESTACETLEFEIKRLGGELIQQVELFDLFRGGRIPLGYKNLAFRVTYQSHEKTLLSEEIQKLHSSIANEISQKFHATFQ